MVGRLFPFWDGNFSGAILNFRWVTVGDWNVAYDLKVEIPFTTDGEYITQLVTIRYPSIEYIPKCRVCVWLFFFLKWLNRVQYL